eukprot:Plantae.Rhodophyta-Purpureofilum_apyrenoidigerum.ctg22121.p1 GENE.Plantae.Rhodophyta-Purpureofilum_apyrenoidigerum.ctg22121~~Plantae.Rhodophyta-Purpureofilum_apyrenoidigerum.ctg22121.p1  ORF type:complete len:454 (+),score=124.89 Plantae.Rhodophyta-Purpureofilum_apyrenoidigerum.ctg22121:110-1471(+)
MGRGSGEEVPMEVEEEKIKLAPEVERGIEEAREMLAKDKNSLNAAVEKLLGLERVNRLAAAASETSALCAAIVRLCFEQNDWDALRTNVVLLSKRRAQLKQAVAKVVQEAISFIDKAPNDEVKLSYLDTLRTVTEGKIFVELERARITRTIAEMKEREGDIDGACDIMQDMQVETYGTMDRREKTEFILEQIRLCLEKKDFIRAGIMSKKVTQRALASEDIEDLVLRYYDLLIRIKLHNKEYLEVCRCYLSRYEKPSIQANEELYLQDLRLAVVFLILSKRDPMQQDLLHRIAAYKTIESLALYKEILKLFRTTEIIHWDHFKQTYGEELRSLVSSAHFHEPPEWEVPLHDRIIEHNLRVISSYFSRLHLKRLAELLKLSEVDAEERITRMVSDEKAIWAKIDRPAGIVVFAKPSSVDTVLNDWAGNVANLLEIVEKTCHLVHKENMVHGIEA